MLFFAVYMVSCKRVRVFTHDVGTINYYIRMYVCTQRYDKLLTRYIDASGYLRYLQRRKGRSYSSKWEKWLDEDCAEVQCFSREINSKLLSNSASRLYLSTTRTKICSKKKARTNVSPEFSRPVVHTPDLPRALFIHTRILFIYYTLILCIILG